MSERLCCINLRSPPIEGMNEQKRKYRVTNGRAYNAALVAWGSLTVWFDEAAVAVQCGGWSGEVFHLPLRALTGFWGTRLPMYGPPRAVKG